MNKTRTIITAISLIVLCSPLVSAGPLIPQDGDVYLGEWVDISLAITWPDFTIVWCKSGYAGCTPPDQIMTITGFQHNFFIDPDRFHLGTYYRWDGQWNHGEYSVAFHVKEGKRPVVNETPTPTPTPTPAPGIDKQGNGPFDYLVARGDGMMVTLHFNEDSDVCSGTNAKDYQGYFWIFGGPGTTKSILNDKLVKRGTEYEYSMTTEETGNLDTGEYTGYLQFTGKNTLQDVYWNPVTRCYDSPYSDTVVPDVCPNTLNPMAMKEAFKTIVSSAKYSDDILVPITMKIVEPEIIITDVVQGPDTLWVTGKTTWAENTPVIIRLDDNNYVKAPDKRAHTWTTKTYGDIGNFRHFNISIPIDIDELYIGMHELKFTVERNGYYVDTYHDFRVSAIYVKPTPTPWIEKYLTDADGNRLTVVTTVIPTTEPTPTPEITEEPTPEPTEEILTPTPTPTPIPTPTTYVVPVNPVIGILALVVAWVVVRR